MSVVNAYAMADCREHLTQFEVDLLCSDFRDSFQVTDLCNNNAVTIYGNWTMEDLFRGLNDSRAEIMPLDYCSVFRNALQHKGVAILCDRESSFMESPTQRYRIEIVKDKPDPNTGAFSPDTIAHRLIKMRQQMRVR
jgi:hypothetical protein